jgi:hypothetical protein
MLTSSVVAAAGHHTNHVPQAHKSRLVKSQREREREREERESLEWIGGREDRQLLASESLTLQHSSS